ncbi:hypothetical protein CC1G_04811 [Coprinopsis cinerea okayama7|uniref:Nephrocystin 3-like N-terminal domain-containing protein n=1 Tax=Coprinopsis cinerea (strain Okayama-7 / 130 / ATCC MYA-4618 / FGSC 9003) TaxID=240176 RepID=A8P2N2_COPC7|nr:hypothetical protein CC1G_04811 [Coprinopsis cinerea okayama7\|eukprot:XP_001838367.2 hypothetical protein CC1G_04811 [Coprinopsis cinerea okayama7\
MAFHQASHFVIDRSHFMNAKVINVANGPAKDPIATLLGHSAVEATHESSTATFAPKCMPGTRTQVINDIINWIPSGDTSNKAILWFSGPAGGGKTCIQREVAKQALEEGVLSGSYFFSTRIGGLDNEQPFVATLVAQFINSIPGYKPLVAQAIRDHPGIFTKSLDIQFQELILDLLPKLACEPMYLPRVLVVDGFDECRDIQQRQHLLKLLQALATNPHVPFRIIISSRPELDIRTAFGKTPLEPLTHCIRLADYDGTNDIRDYFCDGFSSIRETHPSRASIPPGWPPQRDLEKLVIAASSQFIFAATVIKFVSNPHENPVTLLKRVLNHPSQCTAGENPFADLDRLYDVILHPPNTDVALLRRLLRVIMIMEQPTFTSVNPGAFLDEFLGLEPGTTDITLCELHSVLDIPHFDSQPGENWWCDPSTDNIFIRFHHKSLEDYLSSPTRSGDLFQSWEATNLDLAGRCAVHLTRWAEGDVKVKKEVYDYSCMHWKTYVGRALPPMAPPMGHAQSQAQGKSKERRNTISSLLRRAPSQLGAGHEGETAKSVDLPPDLAEFNPAMILQYMFVHPPPPQSNSSHEYRFYPGVAELTEVQEALHRSACKEGQCLRLCMRLQHISSSASAILWFCQRVDESASVSQRVKLLPQLQGLLPKSPTPGGSVRGVTAGGRPPSSLASGQRAPSVSMRNRIAEGPVEAREATSTKDGSGTWNIDASFPSSQSNGLRGTGTNFGRLWRRLTCRDGSAR